MTNGHRGFRLPKQTMAVDFTGGDYEGAEVKLRLDAPIRTAFRFQQLGDEGKVQELLREFGDEVLVEWNLEDDEGKEIPATSEGLMDQPSAFGLLLLEKWTEALQGVDAPLAGTSPNGDTLAAPSPVTESA